MAKNTVLWTLMVVGVLAGTGIYAQSNAHRGHEQAREQRNKESRAEAIVGSWFGTTTTGLRQLLTFHADGTVLRSVPGEVSSNPSRPPHTAAHGVWRYLGKGQFGVTIWDIFYDINTGQLQSYNKLRITVSLARHRDEGNGTAVIDIIDAEGAVTASRMGGITLTRIPFEPIE